MCELSDLTDEGQLRANVRYGLMAVFGGAVAIFGCGANAILAYLFIGKFNYRHSPFFFMGFVAFFDTLIDVMYLFVNTLPISSQQFLWKSIYLLWLKHAQWLLVLVQIFKLTSTFCLVIASYERYHLTKHWTTSGFDYRTRWILLVMIVGMGVFIKVFHPTLYVTVRRPECTSLFSRLNVERMAATDSLTSLFDVLVVALPFFTLIFLNGGIVYMIRRQNVQQLRFLITELTMGKDLTEVRKQNLRSATNTLLFIITTYLIANTLGFFMTIVEYFYPNYYETYYPHAYRMAADLSSLLTVIGNALRCPAHLIVNAEIRDKMFDLCCVRWRRVEMKPTKLQGLETMHQNQWESPWFSALLTTRDTLSAMDDATSDKDVFLRRRSAQSLNPIFDRETIRRLSNVGIV
ncbi:unnamed protein product [Bursaphelenchus okinawaensis]|uniref:G-protein coupled receptors family 1 profile domain-containing protein n=1 Tax=Bursaphelenchus okinawaensis TaxID=465554 RepID=A0A811L1F0_9BILA|nr:unnamed protein product [Bursaphelenchus okinawaensis]CAG9115209.1 unnamed protein product [Bursaphelenchus okinawaensis]